jgi:hypothetical protein
MPFKINLSYSQLTILKRHLVSLMQPAGNECQLTWKLIWPTSTDPLKLSTLIMIMMMMVVVVVVVVVVKETDDNNKYI